MDIYTGLIVIFCIYCVLLFFDAFFKSCAHYPYLKFLEGTGFEVKLFQLKWTTKAFNRLLIRLGNGRSRFLDVWFTIGLYASLVLLPIAIYLLLVSFLKNFVPSNLSDGIVIEPVVPGLNLPLSELGYYSLSLILCSIVHEAGHALAAVRENVNLEHVGLNIIFILPVAYVVLGTEKLFALKGRKTLKILCAGVWHNIVLSLIAFLIYLCLPQLFSVLYNTNQGVTVVSIAKLSPLQGPKGLKVGDAIIGINDCNIFDTDSWVSCLKVIHTKKSAFCLDSDLIHKLDESVPLKHLDNGYMDCCEGDRKENFCFEYLDKASSDGILNLPSHVCLPARTVIERTFHYCSFEPYECPSDLYCFRPLVENYTNIFKIVKNDNSNVIYSGPVSDVYSTIEISPYRVKYSFQSTEFPDRVTKMLKYLMIFSMGLGLINVIPCWFMDGQYIFNILGNMTLLKVFGKGNTKLIIFIITSLVTCILVFHCIFAVCNMMMLV